MLVFSESAVLGFIGTIMYSIKVSSKFQLTPLGNSYLLILASCWKMQRLMCM